MACCRKISLTKTFSSQHYHDTQKFRFKPRPTGLRHHRIRPSSSLSVGLPESFAPGGGPIDPQDYLAYEVISIDTGYSSRNIFRIPRNDCSALQRQHV